MSSENSTDSSLQLGFASECQPWKLESRFFPSKIGGKPSWLDLTNLPNIQEMSCDKCRQPCVHLCQIYAPIDDLTSCFHRSLFVFFCRNSDCCEENSSLNFKVFRCQLPRKNPFYPFEPPVEEENWRTDIRAEMYNQLCYVCGNSALNKCSRCKVIFYCSKEHQKIDWAAGHKAECSANFSKEGIQSRRNNILLKEYEISIESEDTEEVTPKISEEESLKQYEDLLLQGKGGTLHEESSVEEDLAAMAMEEDKAYSKFKKIINSNPEQILRYERQGNPLWVSAVNIPEELNIPKCQYCNGRRYFEFQILPQMLNYLELDDIGRSIDWGTLAVYTCSNSCDQGPAYKKEFIWKQDFKS